MIDYLPSCPCLSVCQSSVNGRCVALCPCQTHSILENKKLEPQDVQILKTHLGGQRIPESDADLTRESNCITNVWINLTDQVGDTMPTQVNFGNKWILRDKRQKWWHRTTVFRLVKLVFTGIWFNNSGTVTTVYWNWMGDDGSKVSHCWEFIGSGERGLE